jgi:hypothetical protein
MATGIEITSKATTTVTPIIRGVYAIYTVPLSDPDYSPTAIDEGELLAYIGVIVDNSSREIIQI